MSSKEYFDTVSTQWDEMRKEFFPDTIREKICEAAAAQKGEIAVDVGAGTGFLTEALLRKELFVTAIDQSEEMLTRLKSKFEDSDRLVLLQGNGHSIPLKDNTADIVVANMYLHHTENPQTAIREMARILKPNGKLVFSDLDQHDHEFLRTEQYDVWLGFDREDIKTWMKNAGLSHIQVESIGENCCCSSCRSCDSASVSIFLASAEKP